MYFSIKLLEDYQGYFNIKWDSSKTPSKKYPIDRNNVLKSLTEYENMFLSETDIKQLCERQSFGNQVFIETDELLIYKYLIAVGDPTFIDYHYVGFFCTKKKIKDGWHYERARKSKQLKKEIRNHLPKKIRMVRSGFSIF